MCISPVRVLNQHNKHGIHLYDRGTITSVSSRYVSNENYLYVPCGKCAECRHTYFESLRQRAQIESLSSYVYFVTLTYDDRHIPHLSFTSDTGVFNVYYADFAHLQHMFKRLRHNCSVFTNRDFRYLAASEFGTEKFRPHIHLLLYVSKLPYDDETTPHIIQKILFDDIKLYFAVNIGTRKNPIYDCYFTYKSRIKNGKLHTNYSVQLVVDKDPNCKLPNRVNTPESVLKSINYLISYVNKTSRFDSIIEAFIEKSVNAHLDPILLSRIKRILTSKVVYSKNFGWGFYENGSKVVPSIRTVLSTDKLVLNTEIYNSLPDTYEEFKQIYFTRSVDYELFLNAFRKFIISNDYDSFRGYLKSHIFAVEDCFNLIFMYKYHRKLYNSFMHAQHLYSEYHLPILPSSFNAAYEHSIAYKTIRRAIDLSLRMNSKYFFFATPSSTTSSALCRYYKQYVVTIDDIDTLYKNLNVTTFDQYLSLFIKSYESYRKSRIRQSLNDNKPIDEDDIITKNDVKVARSVKNGSLILQSLDSLSIFMPTYNSINIIYK